MEGMQSVGIIAATLLVVLQCPRFLQAFPSDRSPSIQPRRAQLQRFPRHGSSLGYLRSPLQPVKYTHRQEQEIMKTTSYGTRSDEYATSGPTTTLLIGSEKDPASCSIMKALIARGDWCEVRAGQSSASTVEQAAGRAWEHVKSPVSLWSIPGSLLDLDDADRRWSEQDPLGGPAKKERRWPDNISDVIFLSQHAAQSGAPALRVHPIGLPNVSTTRRNAAHQQHVLRGIHSTFPLVHCRFLES